MKFALQSCPRKNCTRRGNIWCICSKWSSTSADQWQLEVHGKKGDWKVSGSQWCSVRQDSCHWGLEEGPCASCMSPIPTHTISPGKAMMLQITMPWCALLQEGFCSPCAAWTSLILPGARDARASLRHRVTWCLCPKGKESPGEAAPFGAFLTS